MTAQEILNKFYLAYWLWLEAGAPDHNEHEFHRGIGLCGNLTGMKTYSFRDLYSAKLIMQGQFISCGMDDAYPFSETHEYFEESAENACYLNPQRRAWVEKQVSQMTLRGAQND